MNIKQNIFSGIRPQSAIHLLNAGEAQTALNCKLDKGDLRPWKKHKSIKSVSGLGTPKTLYLYKNEGVDNWITSNDEYDFARSPVSGEAHNRLYYTGPDEPRVIASDIVSDPFDFTTDYYKLGVPAPTSAPTIDSGYTTGISYRAYVYSYVVRLGDLDVEEGPPSDIAFVENYISGTVSLSGFIEPPSERQIGKIRVYRTNASTAGVTAFQFVGSFLTAGFDFDTGTFADGVAEADLGTDGPQPESYVPPPTNMRGLTALLNGAFAGFVGNVIYISEPNLPHAWPYSYPIDATIVGLAWFGSSGIALTDSHVYLLLGEPEAMSTMKLDGIYPCVSKRGILTDVGREGGVIFPSEDGWVMANQNGIRNVSKSFIDPTYWRDNYHPSTTHAYFHEEKVFAFYAEGVYVIDFFNDRFTTINIYADSAHNANATGKFYLIKPNEDTGQPGYDHAIYEWEGNDVDFMQYTWKSKRFILPYTTNFAIARVLRSSAELSTIGSAIADNAAAAAANVVAIADGDISDTLNDDVINFDEVHGDDLVEVLDLDMDTDIIFKLFADGTLIHTETVQDDEPFRLPGETLYKEMECELIGYVPIKEIALAPSVEELEGGANA